MKPIVRLLLSSILLLVAYVGQSATITVSNLNDSGPGSLRQAAADASPGDTINFGVDGEVALTSSVILLNKNLTIQGSGTNLTSVSGSGLVRVFQVQAGATVLINDLTITRGWLAPGNFPVFAAGVHNSGTLTMTRCWVHRNITEEGGTGGIFSNGVLELRQCLLTRNQSQGGAGLINSGSAAVIDCFITDHNGGSANYGGIVNDGSLVVERTLIAGNGGKGILNTGSATVRNSTISGNRANQQGGGAINNNSPSAYLEVDHCTITANFADRFGGGIRNNGTAVLKNSIIAKNNTVSEDEGPDLFGVFTSLGYNIVGANNGATLVPNTGDQIGTFASPVDPLIGPLQDNGGPTATHALLPGSPALDAGDCTDADGNPVTTDQRGVSRPQGIACDIGAFELEVDSTPPEIISIIANPDSIWPPNKKMRPVEVSVVVTDESGPVTCQIVGVTVSGPGAGMPNEVEITGALTLNVRARKNNVYTITVECEDSEGNTSTGTVDVIVAHD